MIENNVEVDHATMNTVWKANEKSLENGVSEGPQARFDTLIQALSFFERCAEDRQLDPGAATYFSLFRLFAMCFERASKGDYDPAARINSNEIRNEEIVETQDDELVAWMGESIFTSCQDAPLVLLDIGVYNNAFN